MRIGLPALEALAPFVGFVEITAGALVLIGLFTQPAAGALAGVMVVAIVTTKIPILLGTDLGPFKVRRLQTYGFWSMAHEARTDWARSEVEIGWTFLARSHWGGRYNGEMKRLMLEHAFRFVDRVVFLVGPHNRRSQRAVEKIGGVPVGSRLDASGRDSVVYQITADAFGRGGRG